MPGIAYKVDCFLSCLQFLLKTILSKHFTIFVTIESELNFLSQTFLSNYFENLYLNFERKNLNIRKKAGLACQFSKKKKKKKKANKSTKRTSEVLLLVIINLRRIVFILTSHPLQKKCQDLFTAHVVKGRRKAINNI